MTIENITDLRKEIEGLDHEIFDKIVELSQAIKCFRKKNDADIGKIQFVNSDIENLACKKRLNVDAVSKIFKEIMLLVNDREVKLC